MEKIGIIIPTYNRKEDLERCMESIVNQDFIDYVIIIVDNGSTDGTMKMLEKFKENLNQRLKFILNKENVGASEARNQALRIINAEYILFLDSDSELSKKQTITNMIKIMESKIGKEIGQLGGEIVDGKIRLGNEERNQDGNFDWADSVKMKKLNYIPTSNCLVRLSVMKKIGGFDPYYIYGFEDHDIGWRIRKLNLKCYADSKVLANHHVSFMARKSNFFLFHRNRVRFLIKKESFFFLLFLPIHDFITTIKLAPKRVKEFSAKPLNDVAWYNKKKQSQNKAWKIIVLGFDYYFNLIKAYFWNITHLPQTLKIRFANQDFLKNVIQ